MVKRNRTLYRSIYFIATLALLPLLSKAQKTYEATGDIKIAKQFFGFGDYITSLKEYQYLYHLDSNNNDLLYPLAYCYLHTNLDKKSAIPIFEKVIHLKDFDPQAMYELGLAYEIAYRFDEAIECFEKYKKLSNNSNKNDISPSRQIEMCHNAIELIKHPVNVTFENLGPRINSTFPDYNPFINKNETSLYFTSKRVGNNGNIPDLDGYPTADVFYADNKYGEWEKGKRLVPTINSPLVEESCGISADGSYVFIFIDNFDAKLQTRVAIKEGKSFQKITALGSTINPLNNAAKAASITPDKKTMFFSSKRDGGLGGSDLFMAKLLPTGQWSTPENLGKVVNTAYNEDFPSLAPDGKTLYFSSAGHNSMGGMDIFRTEWNRETNTFSEPVNIGYPVNTPDDNNSISFTASGKYAYISALRDDTYGNLDIYRVIFNDIKAGYTTLIGTLTERDSLNIYAVFAKKINARMDSITKKPDFKVNPSEEDKAKVQMLTDKLKAGPDIKIQVQNNKTQTSEGTYKPNKQSGKFILILSPGEYTITINCEGYQESKEIIKIADREMPIKEISRNFHLNSK